MKNQLRKILQAILRFFAVKILAKYRPEVVAVTGSVGKTSTKEAIFAVLSSTCNVRRNQKNYNNEIGIPLTIISAEAGGRSVLKWLSVFLKALGLLIFRNKKYPEILVLEMGADHPGDLKYLTGLAPVKIAVVTAVAPAHLEYFKTLEDVAKEKSNLVKNLPKTGFAILNHDDKLVLAMKEKTNAQVLTFGLLPGADILGSEISVSHEVDYKDISTIQGISFKLSYQGSLVPVLLPKVVGQHLVYTALAAIAVGLAHGLNLHAIVESLRKFEPPKGRMNIILGIKNTLLIDDTYNSSPLAAAKALRQLSLINFNQRHKKYAVLGDMLELGGFSEQAHQELGQAVAERKIDYLVTVGGKARDIVRGAVGRGMPKDDCFSFAAAEEAGKFLQPRIAEGDLLLVKGSQGMRMEKIVKELMAEPWRAKELLVRQGREWA